VAGESLSSLAGRVTSSWQRGGGVSGGELTHDLMEKVTYRPAGWLVYRGQLDAEAERPILTEMLKGEFGPRASLYGPFEYDDGTFPNKLLIHYIKSCGFIHPIYGLVKPIELAEDDLKSRVQEALAAPSWSEGVQGAAMLLYLSLDEYSASNAEFLQQVLALGWSLCDAQAAISSSTVVVVDCINSAFGPANKRISIW